MEKYDQAIEEFKRVIELEPTHDQALEALGLNYGKIGEFETAVFFFEKALELKPENKLYLFNLAVTHMKLENYPEAKNTYLRILALDRDNEGAKAELQKLQSMGY